MRRLPLAASIAALAAAATAAAQPPPGAVQLVPNEAGKPSELRVELGPESLPPSGEVPSSIVLASARGFRFDRRARGATCSGEAAASYACPERSRIGRGTAEILVRGPLLPAEGLADSAALDFFLAPPVAEGDVFGVEVQLREERYGVQQRSTGRLVPLSSGPFGSELRFENLAAPDALPPGYTVELRRLELTAGASRTVRKSRVVRRGGKRRRVTRRVRYHLIRNPPTCAGSWAYELRLGLSSGEQRTAGEVPCTP